MRNIFILIFMLLLVAVSCVPEEYTPTDEECYVEYQSCYKYEFDYETWVGDTVHIVKFDYYEIDGDIFQYRGVETARYMFWAQHETRGYKYHILASMICKGEVEEYKE